MEDEITPPMLRKIKPWVSTFWVWWKNILSIIGVILLLREFGDWIIQDVFVNYKVSVTPGEFRYANEQLFISYVIKNESTSDILITSHKILSNYDTPGYIQEYGFSDNYNILEHDNKGIAEPISVGYWFPYQGSDSIYQARLKENAPITTRSFSIILCMKLGSTTTRDTVPLGHVLFYSDPAKTTAVPDLQSTRIVYD